MGAQCGKTKPQEVCTNCFGGQIYGLTDGPSFRGHTADSIRTSHICFKISSKIVDNQHSSPRSIDLLTDCRRGTVSLQNIVTLPEILY